ncbi:Hypothetical protein A7982_01316 [Minicystis rosea]|nr:Hypothetical protein A7982_01316 [Minicystis rosea]
MLKQPGKAPFAFATMMNGNALYQAMSQPESAQPFDDSTAIDPSSAHQVVIDKPITFDGTHYTVSLYSWQQSFSVQVAKDAMPKLFPAITYGSLVSSGTPGTTATNEVSSVVTGAPKGLKGLVAALKGGSRPIMGPATLLDAARQAISAADAALGEAERKARALDKKGEAIARNLEKLEARAVDSISARDTNRALESELHAIAQKLEAAAQSADATAITQHALELDLLASRVAVLTSKKDGTKEKAALDQAVKALGAFALESFWKSRPAAMSDDDAVKALSDHLMNAYRSGAVDAGTAAINTLAKSSDPSSREYHAAKDAATKLAEQHQREMRAEGPSRAERDAPRAPSEVVVHLMSAVEALQAKQPSPVLAKITRDAEAAMLKHELTVEQTRKLLGDAKALAEESGLTELGTLIEDAMTSKLPASSAAMPLTRLHDNIYGRVFESSFIADLVASSPVEVAAAMTATAKATAEWLDKPPAQGGLQEQTLRNVAKSLQNDLSRVDPRFWFSEVPALERIQRATSDDERIAAMKDYLNADKATGYESLSVPYVMVKLWNAVTQAKILDWKERANENYRTTIQAEAKREHPIAKHNMNHPETEGAGITLRHQPTAVIEPGTLPSTRPSTVYTPKITPEDKDVTASTKAALEHGIPFAGGVSGTTNIMLHLFEHLAKTTVPDLDIKSFLLGTMMFVVHDGGHSMHEVLWTANQLDASLNLGLNLGDSSKPREFVADYQKLIALFENDRIHSDLAQASAKAFDATRKYFDTHSHYAASSPSSDSASTTPSTSANASSDASQSPTAVTSGFTPMSQGRATQGLRGLLSKVASAIKGKPEASPPAAQERSHLDENKLVAPHADNTTPLQDWNPTHREWYLDQATLLDAYRNATDAATQKQLALLMMHSLYKAAAIHQDKADAQGRQISAFLSEGGTYHRSTANPLLDQMHVAYETALGFPPNANKPGTPTGMVHLIDSDRFSEVLAREYALTIDGVPLPQRMNDLDHFRGAARKLIEHVDGRTKEAGAQPVLFDVSSLLAEKLVGAPLDAKAVEAMARDIESAFLDEVNHALEGKSAEDKAKLVDKLASVVNYRMQVVAFTQHSPSGRSMLVTPRLFDGTLTKRSELSGEMENLISLLPNIRQRSLTEQLGQSLSKSGYRVDPVTAMEAWLDLESVESIFAKEGIPLTRLGTKAGPIPQIHGSVQSFLGEGTTFAKFKDFAEQAGHAKDPGVEVLSQGTVALLEGLSTMETALGVDVHHAFAQKGLGDLLQTAYFRMETAMKEAMTFPGPSALPANVKTLDGKSPKADAAREDKRPPSHFANQIELIHQQAQAILEIVKPYHDADFERGVLGYLGDTIPNGLEAHAEVYPSAMHTLASTLAAVEKQKGSNALNIAVLADSYYESAGAIEHAKTYDVVTLDGTTLKGGKPLGDGSFTKAEPDTGKKAPGAEMKTVQKTLAEVGNKKIDVFLGEFRHNISGTSRVYAIEDLAHQVDQLFEKELVANQLTVVIDNTIDKLKSEHIERFLEHNRARIEGGELNVAIFRSAQKFDMLGMDNYYGGFVVNVNDPKSFASFNERSRDPVDRLKGLNRQGLTHTLTHMGRELDAYRAGLMANTKALYEKIPAGLKHDPTATLPDGDIRTEMRISMIEDDDRQVFLDIDFNPKGQAYYNAFISELKAFIEANNLPVDERSSFGFAVSNLTGLPKMGKLRFNPGLERPEQLEQYADFFQRWFDFVAPRVGRKDTTTSILDALKNGGLKSVSSAAVTTGWSPGANDTVAGAQTTSSQAEAQDRSEPQRSSNDALENLIAQSNTWSHPPSSADRAEAQKLLGDLMRSQGADAALIHRLGELIQSPGSISQDEFSTCALTSAVHSLLQNDLGGFARLVTSVFTGRLLARDGSLLADFSLGSNSPAPGSAVTNPIQRVLDGSLDVSRAGIQNKLLSNAVKRAKAKRSDLESKGKGKAWSNEHVLDYLLSRSLGKMLSKMAPEQYEADLEATEEVNPGYRDKAETRAADATGPSKKHGDLLLSADSLVTLFGEVFGAGAQTVIAGEDYDLDAVNDALLSPSQAPFAFATMMNGQALHERAQAFKTDPSSAKPFDDASEVDPSTAHQVVINGPITFDGTHYTVPLHSWQQDFSIQVAKDVMPTLFPAITYGSFLADEAQGPSASSATVTGAPRRTVPQRNRRRAQPRGTPTHRPVGNAAYDAVVANLGDWELTGDYLDRVEQSANEGHPPAFIVNAILPYTQIENIAEVLESITRGLDMSAQGYGRRFAVVLGINAPAGRSAQLDEAIQRAQEIIDEYYFPIAIVRSTIPGSGKFPYGKMRNAVMHSEATQALTRSFARANQHPYVSIQDFDTGQRGTPGGNHVFEHLHQRMQEQGSRPLMIAGGYRPGDDFVKRTIERFEAANESVPDELTKNGGEAFRSMFTEHIYEDMASRQEYARRHPLLPYAPEPNLFLDALAVVYGPKLGLDALGFGDGGAEFTKLAKNLAGYEAAELNRHFSALRREAVPEIRIPRSNVALELPRSPDAMDVDSDEPSPSPPPPTLPRDQQEIEASAAIAAQTGRHPVREQTYHVDYPGMSIETDLSRLAYTYLKTHKDPQSHIGLTTPADRFFEGKSAKEGASMVKLRKALAKKSAQQRLTFQRDLLNPNSVASNLEFMPNMDHNQMSAALSTSFPKGSAFEGMAAGVQPGQKGAFFQSVAMAVPHAIELISVLASHLLPRIHRGTPMDGNCLYHAIVQAQNGGHVNANAAATLRQRAVEWVLNGRNLGLVSEYAFNHGVSIDELIGTLAQDGNWAGDAGDLVPWVLASMLGVTIVVHRPTGAPIPVAPLRGTPQGTIDVYLENNHYSVHNPSSSTQQGGQSSGTSKGKGPSAGTTGYSPGSNSETATTTEAARADEGRDLGDVAKDAAASMRDRVLDAARERVARAPDVFASGKVDAELVRLTHEAILAMEGQIRAAAQGGSIDAATGHLTQAAAVAMTDRIAAAVRAGGPSVLDGDQLGESLARLAADTATVVMGRVTAAASATVPQSFLDALAESLATRRECGC